MHPAPAPRSTPRTSLGRALAGAAGAALVAGFVWHLLFGDEVWRAAVQALVLLAVLAVPAVVARRRGPRPRA